MNFEQWMMELNRIFRVNFAGMTSDDFEDWNWFADFDNGQSPLESFREWKDETNH